MTKGAPSPRRREALSAAPEAELDEGEGGRRGEKRTDAGREGLTVRRQV